MFRSMDLPQVSIQIMYGIVMNEPLQQRGLLVYKLTTVASIKLVRRSLTQLNSSIKDSLLRIV